MSNPILPPDIAFLTGSGFSEGALFKIARAAVECGVYPHEHALSNGFVSEKVYYRELARVCDISFIDDVSSLDFPQNFKNEEIGIACRAGIVRAGSENREFYLTAPCGRDVLLLLARIKEMRSLRQSFIVTTPEQFRQALLQKNSVPLLRHTVDELHATRPADSALRSYGSLFRILLIVIFAISVSMLLRAPLFAPLFGLIGAAFYLLACYLRILAYGDHIAERRESLPRLSERDLPVCSVLVPIYKEARLVPQLLDAFAKLDYPRAKLDIIFLIEESDGETAQALNIAKSPPYCRVITVPEGKPRTKPRALQVGLAFVRGEMVTIFDAEDIPHPLQPRHAAAKLHAGGPRLASVQAQLHVENAGDLWLAKQFALEYGALYTVFQTSLAQRGLPILLGGTSNYFRTHVLRHVGGWDPWNVTEDADLGVRLARAGYYVGTIGTPTEEEAPVTLRNWFFQRMRWQKGWLQTLAVHFSQPGKMYKELGLWRLSALTATLGVSLLSVFVYPVTLAWIILSIFFDLKDYGVNLLGAGVFGACIAAFVGGNFFPLLHLQAGAKRANLKFDLFSFFTVWAYWLLISASAYAALYDLARSPYRWFKTEHAGRPIKLAPRLRLVHKADMPLPVYKIASRARPPVVRFADLAQKENMRLPVARWYMPKA